MSDLILGDQVKVDEGLMKESCDVLDLLKNLWVITDFDKLYKLLKYLLYRAELIGVGTDEILLIHEPLLLFLKFPFEAHENLLFLLG